MGWRPSYEVFWEKNDLLTSPGNDHRGGRANHAAMRETMPRRRSVQRESPAVVLVKTVSKGGQFEGQSSPVDQFPTQQVSFKEQEGVLLRVSPSPQNLVASMVLRHPVGHDVEHRSR